MLLGDLVGAEFLEGLVLLSEPSDLPIDLPLQESLLQGAEGPAAELEFVAEDGALWDELLSSGQEIE